MLVDIAPGGIRKIQLYTTSKWGKKTASQVRKATGADVVINGTLYNPSTWKPLCDVKQSGKVLSDDAYSYRGLAWNDGDDHFTTALSGAMGQWDNFISCVMLVNDGKALPISCTPDVKRSAGRTAIIGFDDGTVRIWCVKEGVRNQTPTQLQNSILAMGKVKWALMLDGGGSSQLSQEGSEYIYSTRRVHNYLCFWRKQKDGCPHPEPTALVRKGSSGSGSRWVQWQLQRHGGDLAVDGAFGAESDRTLRAFQRAYGLEVDGICGPVTRAKLKAEREKTARAVLYVAGSQVGTTESPAGSNRVKYNTAYYGREVSGSAYPWCVTFVWWVFRQAGFNLYQTASCTALVERYREASPGQIVRTDYRPGDIVFFDFSGKRAKTEHVGIVESVAADGTLTTIEGNTGSESNANGGAVMRRTRRLGLVTCGIRPGYSE